MLTASDALTAYESFVILSNFDSLIKSEFGDSIDINETLFNQITAESNKYQLADKADSMNKTWRLLMKYLLTKKFLDYHKD